jgi:hypothetical protein
LGRPPSHVQPPTSEALPFAGRTAELRALREWAARTVRPLALIEGEPGIGKTRLAEEFIRESKLLPLVSAARGEQSLHTNLCRALRALSAPPAGVARGDCANLPPCGGAR